MMIDGCLQFVDLNRKPYIVKSMIQAKILQVE